MDRRRNRHGLPVRADPGAVDAGLWDGVELMETDKLEALLKAVTPGPFKALPPREVLLALLRYDRSTGTFIWRERGRGHFSSTRAHNAWNAKFSGRQALASINSSGYLYGSILGEPYFAHRVAWAMFFDITPYDEIDHINRNPLDNRIENLRLATRSMNERNKPVRRDSASQIRGVAYDARYSTWQASIKIGGRKVHLGSFRNADDAIAVRRIAEITIGGGYV